MSPPGRVGAVVLGAAFLLMVPVRVAAQADLRMLLNPELGKQISRADYRYTFYPERPVDQGGTLAMMEHRLSASVPLFQNSRDEFAVAAGVPFRTSPTTHSCPMWRRHPAGGDVMVAHFHRCAGERRAQDHSNMKSAEWD
jgi:hypothetical protein